MKTCSRCRQEKSLSEFATYRNTLPSGAISEGVRRICKVCQNAAHKRTFVPSKCPECATENPVRKDTFAVTGGLCKSCSQRARIARDGHFAQSRKGKRLADEPAYKRLLAMKTRCSSTTGVFKRRYRDRGITVCDAWLANPWAFVDWANANGFAPHLTIDRIDNDRGYSPDNCRWVDMQAQSRNTSSNRPIMLSDGRLFGSLAEAAEALGTSQGRVYKALRNGWKCMGFGVSYADGHDTPLPSS